jgi:hypothetical protein
MPWHQNTQSGIFRDKPIRCTSELNPRSESIGVKSAKYSIVPNELQNNHSKNSEIMTDISQD